MLTKNEREPIPTQEKTDLNTSDYAPGPRGSERAEVLPASHSSEVQEMQPPNVMPVPQRAEVLQAGAIPLWME
jgi:hypothetical protein